MDCKDLVDCKDKAPVQVDLLMSVFSICRRLGAYSWEDCWVSLDSFWIVVVVGHLLVGQEVASWHIYL